MTVMDEYIEEINELEERLKEADSIIHDWQIASNERVQMKVTNDDDKKFFIDLIRRTVKFRESNPGGNHAEARYTT